MNNIELKLVEASHLTCLPCHVCGGHTEKDTVSCEGGGICVCPECLKAGNIDERLEETAKRYEADAAKTSELKGRLNTPSYLEWFVANNLEGLKEESADEIRSGREAHTVKGSVARAEEWIARGKGKG
jgi:ribosome-binding protein aMBF1 (putative translation factor)